MTTNYLIWLLVKPSHIVLFAAVLGVVLWRRPLGGWCRRAAVVLLVAFGLLPTAYFVIKPLETRFAIPRDSTAAVTGIIVLAGAELPVLTVLHDQPQLNSMGDRLTTFLMLAHQYPQARLIHSGAFDSATAKKLLLGAGLPSERIVFEDRSSDTCDSAVRTRDLVNPRPEERWLLVTSAFHQPRAVACFRAVDWDVVPYPADFQRGASALSFGLVDNLADLDLATHEWLGLLYYRLRGYTRELFPAPRPGGR